jgi:hypothetical protein
MSKFTLFIQRIPYHAVRIPYHAVFQRIPYHAVRLVNYGEQSLSYYAATTKLWNELPEYSILERVNRCHF